MDGLGSPADRHSGPDTGSPADRGSGPDTGSPADHRRIAWIDALRGVAMLLMLLDHARTFFVNPGYYPLDPYKSDLLLYLTRWITHLAAPAFVILAGAAAFLRRKRDDAPGKAARYLAGRGLLLVVLEFTIVGFSWRFRFAMPLVLQVIGALGFSMLVTAALLRLRPVFVGGLGVLVLLLRPLLALVPAAAHPESSLLVKMLDVPAFVRFAPGVSLEIVYPLLPWLAVFLIGYGLGGILSREPAWLRPRLRWAGIALLAAFLLVRLANGFGNARPWSVDDSLAVTLFSFFNVEKYPPDMAFLSVTFGLLALIAAMLQRGRGAPGPLVVLGRTPLLFYLLHLPLLHLLSMAACRLLLGHDTISVFESQGPAGFPLFAAYAAAAAGLAILYPLCRWRAGRHMPVLPKKLLKKAFAAHELPATGRSNPY